MNNLSALRPFAPLLCAAAFLLSPAASAGGVRILDPAGAKNYPSIRLAVEAAEPGDTLIVGDGWYGPFVIDRPLHLFAAPGANVRVAGSMRIDGVTEGKVVVNGLEFVGTSSYVPARIDIRYCTATVRIASCTVLPNLRSPTGASTGAQVIASTDVAFTGCSFTGAEGIACWEDDYGGGGGQGGVGLRAYLDSSVAVFDSDLVGGEGFNCAGSGSAGRGVWIHTNSFLFVSGSRLTRGAGYVGSSANSALHVDDTSSVEMLDSVITGGSSIAPGGALIQLPGKARLLDAPAVVPSDAPLLGTARGRHRDRFKFLPSDLGGFDYRPPLRAPWLQPALQFLPTGFALPQVPAGGSLAVELAAPALEPDQPGALASGQGLFYEIPHRPRLASAIDTLVLNRDATTPDCNGNGIGDYLEVIEGLARDANHDLVPDACHYAGPVWYVDASAAPGGDGSPGAPLRTIREGMEYALPGQEVVVADGIYSGPDNRNMNFDGKQLFVHSAHGPAACIIDCEDAGRALEVYLGETNASVFQGFTILDASEDGTTPAPYVDRGGAVRVEPGASVTVRDCIIEDNDTPTGAAFYCRMSPATRIVDCTIRVSGFRGTFIEGGGTQLIGTTIEGQFNNPGVWIVPSEEGVTLSGCAIRDNGGGGVHIEGTANGVEKVFIDNCLIANNHHSTGGGGIYLMRSATVHVQNSALVGNSTSHWAGAAFWSQTNRDGRDIRFENTIVWGNSPTAMSLAVHGQGDSSLHVERSDVEGGLSGTSYVVSGSSMPFPFLDNMNTDPLFVDLVDYRPGAGSPCIDAGDNSLAPPDRADLDGDGNTTEPVPHDRDGNPRFVDDPAVADTGAGTPPLVDIGPYERQP